jgi:foldase protein PrsA
MSERNHSPEVAVAPSPARRRRLIPMLAGTTVAIVGAGLLFQVLRPEPAVSQTREPAPRGTQSPAARPTGTQPAVASVNGQPISYEVLAAECVERHGQQVLDNLVNKIIIQQACESRNIKISDAEIAQEVISIAKKFNLPPDTWYQMLQSERGLTPDQYRRDIIWPMVALRKLAGADISPTEEDMANAFEREYGPRVKARMVLVDGNVRQATKIWEEANQDPDNFEQIARKYSADPNTRPLGGVIPPIRKNGGNPNVEKEAFKLKVGEISSVIQVSDSRYVIIKCEGHTEQLIKDPKEVWNDLYNLVMDEKTQQSVAKVFEQVKSEARVINHLTKEATPVSQTRPGQPIQPAGGTQQPNRVRQANATGAEPTTTK